ncbi:unnamed protein product, partial [Ectocarpus fasciculatus]
LQAFSLLPLFHFQLFFFLLESMGGNGFVLCLAWVIVPSVATRVPRLQVLAARHLREMQAMAGGLLAGSLAAGAAGLLTVRLALSAAGLSVAWGFCQAPHWGRGRGTEVMDGLVAGNHLALVLRLGAGLLYPPSPGLRFLESLLLPTLLLLGLWFVPPSPPALPPLRCWRSGYGGGGRGRGFSAGRSSWGYLRLVEEGAVPGQEQQQQQQQQQVDRQLQPRQRQQRRQEQHQQAERRRPGTPGGSNSTAAAAATSAALSGGGGGGGGGGGEGDEGGGLELAVASFRRGGGEDNERGVGRQPRQRRLQRREMAVAAASPAPPMPRPAPPSPAQQAPPTEAIAPGGAGVDTAIEAAAARAAAGGAAAAAAAAAGGAAAAAAADGLFSPSLRPSRPPLLPRLGPRRGGDASQPSPGFLESLVVSAGFGGLLFITVLLAGSPWTGEDWAPSPGVGVFWSALRQASVVLAWGFGRAIASTSA